MDETICLVLGSVAVLKNLTDVSRKIVKFRWILYNLNHKVVKFRGLVLRNVVAVDLVAYFCRIVRVIRVDSVSIEMETLVVVPQHRNQYYSRSKDRGHGGFGSPASRNFREINCRTFQSGAGILPTPLKACTTPVTKREDCTTPVSKRDYSSSPKTPSPAAKNQSEDGKPSIRTARSSPIPIDIKSFNNGKSFNDDLSYSERWAGPAYSNSPPPSSLPIPKFSVKPKRSVSLELSGSASNFKIHPIAKSAPTSPTRESYLSPRDFPFAPDSATKTLRRILNLETADE